VIFFIYDITSTIFLVLGWRTNLFENIPIIMGSFVLKMLIFFKNLEVYCAKLIWNTSIQSSKSLLVWRLFHKKVTTYENLWARGWCVVSRCNLCSKTMKTSQLLFVLLRKIFGPSLLPLLTLLLHFFFYSFLNICKKSWSARYKIVIIVAIINLFFLLSHRFPTNQRWATNPAHA
jgi:hypothetical protein